MIAATPSQRRPARLDFRTLGTGFTELSPLLGQSFFIGDGLTGLGTGAQQQFHAPAGATRLFVGIVDGGFFGWFGPPSDSAPGAYVDNSGSFSVDFGIRTTSDVPEPATAGLVALAMGWWAWRRQRCSA